VTRVELRTMWRQRIEALVESGMSVRRWCKAQGIKEHQARYWLRRFSPARQAAEDPATEWVSVSVWPDESASKDDGVVVRIGRASIEVRPGFDPELLARVVKALSAAC